MFALFLAAAAAPAPATPFRTIGNWNVTRDEDMCIAGSGFGANYEINIGINSAGRSFLGISSDLWKYADNTQLDAAYVLGSITYSGGSTKVVVEGTLRTLVTPMAPGFLDGWRSAERLTVYADAEGMELGDKALASFTLDKTDAAVIDALRDCVKLLPPVKPAANAGKALPSAPPAPPLPTIASKPAYLNKPDVIRAEDYPKAARKAGVAGTTYYRVSVSPTGAPTGCVVTTSSGSASLDAKACELIMARARFTPARDARGRAIAGELDARVFWQLP